MSTRTTTAVLLMMAAANFCAADLPPENPSYAEIAYEPVSIFICLHGDGSPIAAAYAHGGVLVDATITLHLMYNDGRPAANYPAEDLWLDSSAYGLVYCPEGTIADRDTDANGITVWQQPLHAGGSWLSGERLHVFVEGGPLNQPGFLVRFNSPDNDGNLQSNVTDLSSFTADFFGSYSYRSDFNWDDAINLTDVSFFAAHYGHLCP